MNKERLMVFTDAIFAIIMTILVLDIKVPSMEGTSEGELFKQLVKQLPHLYGFILSFAVITVIWFSHHDLFSSLKFATRTFATLNFILIGSIATLPFSTALASEYPHRSLAVASLSGNMLVMNIFLSFMFIYVNKNKFSDPGFRPERISKIKMKMGVIGIFVFLLAFILAFIYPALSLGLIAVVPIMHCLPLGKIFHAT
jgi:uncharacterized membrane protein